MAQRTDWIDYARGIGITFVVYAHLLSSGYHSGLPINEHFFGLSDSIIYSFHMPLFYFLAGMFAKQSLNKRGLKAFITDKIRLLIYPYFVWSFLQAAAQICFSSHTFRAVGIQRMMKIPYIPLDQFWFLYALLGMFVLFGIFSTIPRHGTVIMVVVATYLLFRPINSSIMGLSGLSSGFIFFVIGSILVPHFWSKLEHIRLTMLTVLLLSLFFAVEIYIFHYIIEPTRNLSPHPLYYLFMATLGIACCIGLAHLLANRNWYKFIRIVGTYSLPIFLAHMIVGVGVRVVLARILHVENAFMHLLIGVSMGIFVPILLYKIAQAVKLPYMFELKKVGKPDMHDANRLTMA